MKNKKHHSVGTVPKYNRKNKNHHSVGTVPKYDRKIIKSGKMDTPNTYIHDYSLYLLGTDTNKKWWDKTSSMGQQFFSSLT
jgi:hypothetical protein